MAYSGLKDFIETLERQEELIRVPGFVDPALEITEIADRFSKQPGGGKALLFENTGTRFPLLINSLGSEKRISLAFGRENLPSIEQEVGELFHELLSPKDTLWEKLRLLPRLKQVSSWLPQRVKRRGRCQEVVLPAPDLDIFPILKCWPADGGRFITLPAVHTVDPESGAPNVGMYRMQVFGKELTGMHWHHHKTGATHYRKYQELGLKMPVTVTLGGDPVYTYAATAPMPENMDEYLLAGFLRREKVRLVKCLTNDLYVPEDADIVIEGFVDPQEELIWEGPFGDHTGFYSLADYYPKFHVTCITHRRDAVYPATIVGIPPMEDAWIGKATERIFMMPIRMSMVPELLDMDLPFAGVAHNLSVVRIQKSYPGQAIKVMNSLWGAGQMMFNKFLVVVDEETDLRNYQRLIREGFARFDPAASLHFSKGPLDVLDHASSFFAYGSKLGIDLTRPVGAEVSEAAGAFVEEQALEDAEGVPSGRFIAAHYDLTREKLAPVLLVAVRKEEGYQRELFWQQLAAHTGISRFKLVVMLDAGVDLHDLFTVVWQMGGNIDPLRDMKVVHSPTGRAVLLADATMKSSVHDGFGRDWPNVVVSDDQTIAAVDRKWDELGLGASIPSPSLKYKKMVPNDGAVKKDQL